MSHSHDINRTWVIDWVVRAHESRRRELHWCTRYKQVLAGDDTMIQTFTVYSCFYGAVFWHLGECVARRTAISVSVPYTAIFQINDEFTSSLAIVRGRHTPESLRLMAFACKAVTQYCVYRPAPGHESACTICIASADADMQCRVCAVCAPRPSQQHQELSRQ